MTSPAPAQMPVRELVARLRDRAESVARWLLPDGYRDAQEWRARSTRDGGQWGDSLSIHIGRGDRAGVFAHFAAHQAGDILDAIAYIKCNGSKSAAIEAARGWLAVERPAPAAAAMTRRPPTLDEPSAEQRRRAAHAMYLSAQPIEGTPAEHYLAGRGLVIRRLPYPLHALRYHPGLYDPNTERRWPGMVAAITGSDGKFLAVHRTFLEVLQDGNVTKAPITDARGRPAAKRCLGNFRGGTIRLWRGLQTDPDTGEIKQARRMSACKSGVWIDLTEGIEDGLTVAIADPEARVLVGVSISNMASIHLPACVEGVVLWRDNDAPGSAAAGDYERVKQHFVNMGKRVAEVRAPEGFKDVNDMVRADAHAGDAVPS